MASTMVIDESLGEAQIELRSRVPDPSPEEVARARAAHSHVLTARRRLEGVYLELGKALDHIERDRLYVALGHSSFPSYLADPELSLSHSTAYRCLSIWRSFRERIDAHIRGDASGISEAEIVEIGVSRAEALTRVIQPDTSPAETREWLDKARALSVSDLYTEVRAVTDPPASLCPPYVLNAVEDIARAARRLPNLATQAEMLDDLNLIANAARAAADTLRRQLALHGPDR